MLSFVGLDPTTGIPRYSGDLLFLWDGVDVITAILAFFAIPEMISLGVSAAAVRRRRQRKGVHQVQPGLAGPRRLRPPLVAGASPVGDLGAVIGMIPGLGGETASWMSYGHTVQIVEESRRHSARAASKA